MIGRCKKDRDPLGCKPYYEEVDMDIEKKRKKTDKYFKKNKIHRKK